MKIKLAPPASPYFCVSGGYSAGGPIALVRRLFRYRFTWLVLMGLALSVLLGERVPAGSWSLAPLLALTVPLWLALVAMLVLYWLRRRWRVALLPLAALLLAWPQVQRGLPLHLGSAAQEKLAEEPPKRGQALGTKHQPPGTTLRLLSYNVRIFNLYPQLRQLDPTATIIVVFDSEA